MMTPDQVSRQRRLAEALMVQGQDASPVGHWTQALARVVQGGLGGYQMGQANQAEMTGRASGNAALAAALEGKDPNAMQSAMQNPWSADDALKLKAKASDRAYQEGAMQREAAQRAALAQQYGFKQGTPEFQRFVVSGSFPSQQQGPEDPSTVREFKFLDGLPPEKRDLFMQMKRQNNAIVGDSLISRTDGRVISNVGGALEQGKIAEGRGADIAKTRAELPESKMRLEMVSSGLDRLKQTAQGLAMMPGLNSVVGGLYQAYAPNVSQNALNAETELENLKVKISGVVLQSMRDMSKTGGAVGQVTEREWPRLENMIANLSPKQGREQFLANLQQVVEYADSVQKQLTAAYEQDLQTAQGGQWQPPAAPNVPNAQDLKSKYGLR